jgi:hypothetical protein
MISTKFEECRYILVKSFQISDFLRIRLAVLEFLHADGQTKCIQDIHPMCILGCTPGVQKMDLEDQHSPLSEAKNEWRFTPSPLYAFMDGTVLRTSTNFSAHRQDAIF